MLSHLIQIKVFIKKSELFLDTILALKNVLILICYLFNVCFQLYQFILRL